MKLLFYNGAVGLLISTASLIYIPYLRQYWLCLISKQGASKRGGKGKERGGRKEACWELVVEGECIINNLEAANQI